MGRKLGICDAFPKGLSNSIVYPFGAQISTSVLSGFCDPSNSIVYPFGAQISTKYLLYWYLDPLGLGSRDLQGQRLRQVKKVMLWQFGKFYCLGFWVWVRVVAKV